MVVFGDVVLVVVIDETVAGHGEEGRNRRCGEQQTDERLAARGDARPTQGRGGKADGWRACAGGAPENGRSGAKRGLFSGRLSHPQHILRVAATGAVPSVPSWFLRVRQQRHRANRAAVPPSGAGSGERRGAGPAPLARSRPRTYIWRRSV